MFAMASVFDFAVVGARVRSSGTLPDRGGADGVEQSLVHVGQTGWPGAAHVRQGVLHVR